MREGDVTEQRRCLAYPGVVPIRILRRLGAAGVRTTREIHEHIKAGTLRTLPGIGRKYEQDILHYYTVPDDWHPWPAEKPSGGDPRHLVMYYLQPRVAAFVEGRWEINGEDITDHVWWWHTLPPLKQSPPQGTWSDE